MSFIICVTRFTDETWQENENWKDARFLTFQKRFYNTSIKIKESIPGNHEILVVEMNLTKNKVIAFGLIKNICQQWRYKIYSDDYYNRYTYISSKFIFVEEIPREYQTHIEELEMELFKGKGNLKRGNGIQQIPQKKIKNKEFFQYIYDSTKV